MIKSDKGQVMAEGQAHEILSDFTCICNMIINEFGNDRAIEALAIAMTIRENFERIDLSDFSSLLEIINDDEKGGNE